MEHLRAAERSLVAALVLGEVDPRDLAGRLKPADFTDPAAALLFDVAVRTGGSANLARDLPLVLRREGRLRADGYPVREFLDWLPDLPTPVHAEAWAAMVVAGTLGRQVRASGERLQQSAEAGLDGRCGTGQLLTVVEVQRAALGTAARRWEALPQRWRDTVPHRPVDPTLEPAGPGSAVVGVADVDALGREEAVLAGLIAAPQVLGRLPWLEPTDFTDPSCSRVFSTLRREHEAGRPVDAVTLAATCAPTSGGMGRTPAAVVAGLRPQDAFPSAVPFLARRLVADSICHKVYATGADLVALAQAPATAGGIGGSLLTAAQQRLTALAPCGVRWASASRDLTPARPPRALPRARVPERASVRESSRDRHAG